MKSLALKSLNLSDSKFAKMMWISRFKERVRNRRVPQPPPFRCRHIEYSVLASLDDECGRPSERLLDISLRAIDQARRTDLSWLSKRMAKGPFYPDVWPGEHYKLLSGLVVALRPKRIIEIGTFQGLGSLAMKNSLIPDAELITVDIVPWKEILNSAFRNSDFEDGRLRQVIGDPSNDIFFKSFSQTLSGCDLLFIDGPKNVTFEQILLRKLSTISLPKNSVVVLDDVRLWNMLKIWREIRRPKLDLTSFGHWTGTGLIDWNG